ncbi:MAG TPA: hypothetical protein VFL14_00800 [Xanthomonadales bacterium]|nr:hypothetical protein [Xanthomonadales bacterium]
MHEPGRDGRNSGDGDDRPVLVEHHDHLEVRLSVQRTCPRHREGCVAMLAPLVRARSASRLLVVCTDPSDTIDRVEAYWTGDAIARLLADVRIAIAVTRRPVDYLEDFAAMVARERGTDVRYFEDVEVARRWLLDRHAG